MPEITIRTYDPSVLEQLVPIEKATKERYPEFPFWATWAYRKNQELKPENMWVAYRGGEALGYGHIIPRLADESDPLTLPHTLYFDLNASLTAPDSERIQDALYAAIRQRATELIAGDLTRRTELCIQHYSTVPHLLDFARSKGFEHEESYLLMKRTFDQESRTNGVLPAGLSLREWKMETPEDKQKFLEVEKLAFPDEVATLEKLETLMQIPHWSSFAIFTADDEVIALIMMRAENATQGYIDNVFVLPAYRRQGLAEQLVEVGVHHLRQLGFQSALLHVARSNEPAVRLYHKAQFETVKEQVEMRLALLEA